MFLITVCSEVAKVMFLHLSACPQGGGLPQCILGYHPQSSPPGSRHPPGAGTTPQQTATVSGGTHPTGMHSCSHIFSLKLKTNMSKIYNIFKISVTNVRYVIAEFISPKNRSDSIKHLHWFRVNKFRRAAATTCEISFIHVSHFSYLCKTERENGISRLISTTA